MGVEVNCRGADEMSDKGDGDAASGAEIVTPPHRVVGVTGAELTVVFGSLGGRLGLAVGQLCHDAVTSLSLHCHGAATVLS